MVLPDAFDYSEVMDPDTSSCHPWDADVSCCDEWDEHDESLQARALSLAWNTLSLLTAGRLGKCPVVARPCVSSDACPSCFAGGSWMNPVTDRYGRWVNCRFDGSCSCCSINEVVLPGEVAMVTDVNIDGWHLDLPLVRVDNGNRVVRLDGCGWPSSQNMNASTGEIGAFSITYIPGVRPDRSGLWVAGLLACEFAKACTGGKCRLPSSATVVARQGITMEVSKSMFENGTGIREVDALIESLNPNRLTTAPTVWSPDVPSPRYETWNGNGYS